MKQISMNRVHGHRPAGVSFVLDGPGRTQPIAVGGWFATGQESAQGRPESKPRVDRQVNVIETAVVVKDTPTVDVDEPGHDAAVVALTTDADESSAVPERDH